MLTMGRNAEGQFLMQGVSRKLQLSPMAALKMLKREAFQSSQSSGPWSSQTWPAHQSLSLGCPGTATRPTSTHTRASPIP